MGKAITPIIDEYAPSPVRGKINTALNQIKWVLAYMHDVQEVRLPAALQALAAAKQLRRYARTLERVFDEAAVAEMHMSGVEHYAGEGFEATLYSGGDRKEWQHESLVNELADRFVNNHEGQFPDVSPRDLRRITQSAMNTLVDAGRIEWRSTSLRGMGVDPDEFSVKGPGNLSVRLEGEASYVDNQWRTPRS